MRRAVTVALGLAAVAWSAPRAEAACASGVMWCDDPAATSPAITAGPLGLGSFGTANVYLAAATKVWAFSESTGAALSNFGPTGTAGTTRGSTISTRVEPVEFTQSNGNTALAHTSLFFAATDGYTYSIDATTGLCNWRTFVGRTSSSSVTAIVDTGCAAPNLTNTCGDGVTADPALNYVNGDDTQSVLYVATNHGSNNGCSATTLNRVYALQPSNGQPLWVFNLPATNDYSNNTAAPYAVAPILWSPAPDTYTDYSCATPTNRNQLFFTDTSNGYGLVASTGALLGSFALPGAAQSFLDLSSTQCGVASLAVTSGTNATIYSVVVDPTVCAAAGATPPCDAATVGSSLPLPFRMNLGHSNAARTFDGGAGDPGLFVINSNGTTWLASGDGSEACSYTPGLGAIGDPFIAGSYAYTATKQGTVLQLPLPTSSAAMGTFASPTTCAGAVEQLISNSESTVVGDPGADVNATNTASYIFAGDQAGRVTQVAYPFSTTTHTLWANVTGLNQSGVKVSDGTVTTTLTDNGIVKLDTATGSKTFAMSFVSNGAGCVFSTTAPTLSTSDQYVNVTCTPGTTSYPVNVTVTGLGSDGSPNLVLTDTVGTYADKLSINANATYTFGLQLASGSTYSVAISTAADNGWSCTFPAGATSATGTVSGAVSLTLTCACAAATPTQCGATCVNIGGDDANNCGGCGLYCSTCGQTTGYTTASAGECVVGVSPAAGASGNPGNSNGMPAVDASYVYWMTSSGLAKILKTAVGGTLTLLYSGNYSGGGVAVSGNKIVFATTNSDLRQVNNDGTSLFDIGHSSWDALNVAVDATGTYAYWSEQYANHIYRSTLGGTTSSEMVISTTDSGTRSEFIVVGGNYVYWADNAVQKICRVPILATQPTNAAQTCTATISTYSGGLTTDGMNVYGSFSDGSIAYIPVNETATGGLLTTTTLATGMTGPGVIATDGIAVYSISTLSSGHYGLQKMLIASPNTVTTLMTTSLNTAGLVTDGTSVFLTQYGGNTTIQRVTPK